MIYNSIVKKIIKFSIIYIIIFLVIYFLVALRAVIIVIFGENEFIFSLFTILIGIFFWLGVLLTKFPFLSLTLITIFFLSVVYTVIYCIKYNFKINRVKFIIAISTLLIFFGISFLVVQSFSYIDIFNSFPKYYKVSSVTHGNLLKHWRLAMDSWYGIRTHNYQLIFFLPDNEQLVYSRAQYNCDHNDETLKFNSECKEKWFVYNFKTKKKIGYSYPHDLQIDHLIISGSSVNSDRLFFNDNSIMLDFQTGKFSYVQSTTDEIKNIKRQLVDFIENEGKWCLNLLSEKNICSEDAMFIKQVIITEDENTIALNYDGIYGPGVILVITK